MKESTKMLIGSCVAGFIAGLLIGVGITVIVIDSYINNLIGFEVMMASTFPMAIGIFYLLEYDKCKKIEAKKDKEEA